MNGTAPINRPRNSDEVDLRGVVTALLRGKWLVVVVTALAGVAAFVFSTMRPKRYEAVAQVAITQPVFSLDLGVTAQLGPKAPDINLTPKLPDIRALKDLALADDLLHGLVETQSQDRDTTKFNVTVPSNTQLELAVADRDPQRAAAVANRWAEVVSQRLNRLYGVDETTVEKLRSQLAEAETTWTKASEALIDFLPKSRLDALAARYNQCLNNLAAYGAKLNALNLLISDAQAMSARLATAKETDRLTTDDALALVGLHQRAVGGLGGLQIQTGASGLGGEPSTVAGARAALAGLISSLQKQAGEVKTTITELETELGTLGADQESAKYQRARLTQQRDVAAAAYQALSKQVEETRIFLAQNGDTARVVAKAVPPEEPGSPRPKLNAALGAMLGFLLSILWVLARAWWRTPAQP